MDEVAADPDLTLRFLIADMPERHYLKGLVHHSGKKSCESCLATASSGKGIHWPYDTCAGFPERTKENMQFAAE